MNFFMRNKEFGPVQNEIFLKLPDFAYSDSEFLKFHDNLHFHYPCPPENFITMLLKLFPCLDATQVLSECYNFQKKYLT